MSGKVMGKIKQKPDLKKGEAQEDTDVTTRHDGKHVSRKQKQGHLLISVRVSINTPSHGKRQARSCKAIVKKLNSPTICSCEKQAPQTGEQDKFVKDIVFQVASKT